MISQSMSMRSMVMGVFLLTLAGTGLELLFLKHTQGLGQLIPVVLLVMSLLVLTWHGLERKSASLRAFQITMLLVVAAGILGAGLHYKANAAFELEADPKMHGMQLFTKTLAALPPHWRRER
jgi:hypothetical protein